MTISISKVSENEFSVTVSLETTTKHMVLVDDKTHLQLTNGRISKENLLMIEENTDPKDPKSKLQEYLQKRNLQLPTYSIKLNGSKEKKVDFKVLCEVKGLNLSATGIGKSRKKAELNSAEKILNKIKV